MRVKTATGEIKDVSLLDVTPENYIVPENENGLYHAVIEVKKFDQNSGKRLSVPRLQKFGKKTFETSVRSNLLKQGYTIEILHDPNKWLEENKAKEAEQKAINDQKAIEAKAKAEADAKAKADKEQQKKIDDAVAAALEKQNEANQKAIDAAVKAALANQTKPATAKAETKTADATADDTKTK